MLVLSNIRKWLLPASQTSKALHSHAYKVPYSIGIIINGNISKNPLLSKNNEFSWCPLLRSSMEVCLPHWPKNLTPN